ncbi:MAG: alpha-amylase family glycosyl hydrolase, partial [Anaerolineae bacterium]|nr:alpha-amylase family glycosyl hydrolase [Anaerolineae bacterium]
MGDCRFYISRQARDQFRLDSYFCMFGGVQSARILAQKINNKRAARGGDQAPARLGELYALGIVEAANHALIQYYKKQSSPQLFQRSLRYLIEQVGETKTKQGIGQYVQHFPPTTVYDGEERLEDFLGPFSESGEKWQALLEDILRLGVLNANPAFSGYQELFDDRELREEGAYLEIISALQAFFEKQPQAAPFAEDLITVLRAPSISHPGSIAGQLGQMINDWSPVAGESRAALQFTRDMILEVEREVNADPDRQQADIFDLEVLGKAPERFSQDRDWMPRLVLIAKNIFVWLDQLSNKQGKQISRLDQIPEEALKALADAGITGLWLIGIWERSPASKVIKRRRGNLEAEASAYSLYDYQVAADLGGENALEKLKQAAWKFGIRLGCDMVPNHMGIDSRWVAEHPDWFLNVDHSPFPSYTYQGPDLSSSKSSGIYLEDHYYDHSDAAVVFKHIDHRNERERYIYHGNDGTNMPWNDTAQVDFLHPEARQHVIQTILKVARQFPIIRFDAAMTLANKHIQRLWYPAPGSKQAIPSRHAYGLTAAEFNLCMPQAFWREVVDRAALEAPDSLLLAEAFWMMEGYFVRTLGMHRVYNSAFMHMLRDEDNAIYRGLIKSTIAFNPQILKRYVNFMNNPDEETAIDQFGRGDKYFGVCTLMATLPGLPMFGHGQLEGFREKYGMEYKQAKWDEVEDEGLLARHTQQIFPLLRKRRLFAEVENFLLFDFVSDNGNINQDVFVIANRLGEERALVLYNNNIGGTSGWVRESDCFLQDSNGKKIITRTVGDGLALPQESDAFVVFRDLVTGREHLYSCADIYKNGLFYELGPYQSKVFVDFRIWYDLDGKLSRAAQALDGKGMPDMAQAAADIELLPALAAWRALVSRTKFDRLFAGRLKDGRQRVTRGLLPGIEAQVTQFVQQANLALGTQVASPQAGKKARSLLAAVLKLPAMHERFPLELSRSYKAVQAMILDLLNQQPLAWDVLFCWAFAASVRGKSGLDQPWEKLSAEEAIEEVFQSRWIPDAEVERNLQTVECLLDARRWYAPMGQHLPTPFEVMERWFSNEVVSSFLGVNEYDGVVWFHRESLYTWLQWAAVLAAIEIFADSNIKKDAKAEKLIQAYAVIKKISAQIERSGYQVEKLTALLKDAKK